MNHLLNAERATSVAELNADEIDLVGGGEERTIRMEIECKIDENGNGQCVATAVEKPD